MKQNTLDKRWDGWMRCGWRELVGVLGPFWPAIRHEKHEMIALTTVYARATNVLYRRSQTLEIDRTDIDVHEKITRIKRLCLAVEMERKLTGGLFIHQIKWIGNSQEGYWYIKLAVEMERKLTGGLFIHQIGSRNGTETHRRAIYTSNWL
ncbi:uncharacterized protein [Atheta coriaria]|uniref:uncharacterized protein isoform X2 n=2 Tax=Dalotia coriaria TaxID=877792 RepID=UPI0031F35BD8